VFLASSLGGDLLEHLRAQPALQGHKQRAQQERLTQAIQQEPLMRQEQEEQQVVPPGTRTIAQNWLRGARSITMARSREIRPGARRSWHEDTCRSVGKVRDRQPKYHQRALF
jgi:hypothetical protein